MAACAGGGDMVGVLVGPEVHGERKLAAGFGHEAADGLMAGFDGATVELVRPLRSGAVPPCAAGDFDKAGMLAEQIGY